MSENTNKHTPGPWRATQEKRQPHEDPCDLCCLPHHAYDAIVVFAPKRDGISLHSIPSEEFAANARLIAAAPALLEALEASQSVLARLLGPPSETSVVNLYAAAMAAEVKARAAITAATADRG